MKCDKCKYRKRPKYAFPCSRCIQDNLSFHPITCDDCKGAWFECSKRGKNERRLTPCEHFEWS